MTAPASAQTKDTIVAALAAEGTVLDPARYSAGVDQYFIGQMFEQLVRFDPDLKPVNWLAESWSIEGTAEKPIIDVHIRKGVKFHNGDPLTVGGLRVLPIERLNDPKISRWAHLQANVEKFEIIDDHHFKLHFKAPDGDYIVGSLQLWAMSKKYYEKAGEDGFAKAPVGTGPWKFVSRSIKEDLKLEAFDDYWNKDARPKVKNLVLKIIPEDLTRVAAFKSGAIDWIDAVPLSADRRDQEDAGREDVHGDDAEQPVHQLPDLQAELAVRQAEGAAGGRACGRRGCDHQERAVRAGRALRRRSARGRPATIRT